MEEKRKPMFELQWHLTSACPNRCKHCYIDQHNRVLPLEDCKKVIDDFGSLIQRWICRGRIHFTGGDPLLYPWFFELLDYSRSKIPDIIIDVMGNPELLTEGVAESLQKQRVFAYQMSIDGLEKTHDYIRHPGSFRKTLEKLPLLKRYGIKTTIMTTLSRLNIREIPQIIDLVIQEGVDFFDFRRFVPIGNGEMLKEAAFISPQEFRELLESVEEKIGSAKGTITTRFAKGDPLWALFYWEKGVFHPGDHKDLIWGGCTLGSRGLTILEDGKVLACRRLLASVGEVGKVPDQRLRDIFITSPRLNKLRNFERVRKCNTCPLFPYCRGCRAVACAIAGDYFAPDPQCWKQKGG
jgi:radical SAM/SPASM domain protein of ACGX system